jgi:cytochrome c biogenesis protein CcdA
MITITSAALSYGAGALVAFSPCVLPALPLIASGASQESRIGPMVVAAGLVTGFALVGVSLAAFGHFAGFDQDALRTFGALALAAAGLVMLIRPLEVRFAAALAPLGAAGGALTSGPASGLAGQFAVGAGLGLVWAPCSGPALGAAIALATQAGGIVPATALMLLFGIGAATPLLVAAYGSRKLMLRLRAGAQGFGEQGKRVFGAALLAVALLTLTGLDLVLVEAFTARLPEWWLNAITRL